MVDLSILVPSLRSHYLPRLYNSIRRACKRYSWELVAIGPFLPQDILLEQENFKFIQSYSSVPVCMQKATLECSGYLIAHQVDDGVLQDGSLDDTVDLYHEVCGPNDVINCRYSEGVSFSGKLTPPQFWEVKYLKEFDLPAIDKSWITSVQPLMRRELFIESGGFYCCEAGFHYSNHAHHDLLFRLQNLASKVFHSRVGIANCSHMPTITGDHRNIHFTQTEHDEPIFNRLWSDISVTRGKIDYNNFKDFDKPWSRFEKQLYPDYKSMCEGENYDV